jgi:tripartite-type tricarboxylate transporter receptor subunit TctC
MKLQRPSLSAPALGIALWAGFVASSIGQQRPLAPDGLTAYPVKSIRIVTPYTSGSPVDVLARVVAQELSTQIGQGVIVENRPGAGTTIGNKLVASSAPDGYTLLISGTANVAFTPSLYPDAGYDALKSFAPVATLVVWSHVLIATNQLPAKSIPELVTLARAQPGKITLGYGLATVPHILAETLKGAAKIDITGIPFKGGAQAVSEMLGGRIDLNIGTVATLLPLIRAGKVRPLAFTGRTRSVDLPDVPTTAESGYPDVGFNPDVCSAMFAPAGTPVAIINRLNAEVNAGLASPELKATFVKFGMEPKPASPQELASFMVEQVRKWPGIIKATGVKPE